MPFDRLVGKLSGLVCKYFLFNILDFDGYVIVLFLWLIRYIFFFTLFFLLFWSDHLPLLLHVALLCFIRLWKVSTDTLDYKLYANETSLAVGSQKGVCGDAGIECLGAHAVP